MCRPPHVTKESVEANKKPLRNKKNVTKRTSFSIGQTARPQTDARFFFFFFDTTLEGEPLFPRRVAARAGGGDAEGRSDRGPALCCLAGNTAFGPRCRPRPAPLLLRFGVQVLAVNPFYATRQATPRAAAF